MLKKWTLSKNANNKKCAPKLIFFKNKIQKDSDGFCNGNWPWVFGTFWQLGKIHSTKCNNLLRECWFLAKNLANFISFPWKLDNPNFHCESVKDFIYLVLNYRNYWWPSCQNQSWRVVNCPQRNSNFGAMYENSTNFRISWSKFQISS